MSNGGKLTIVLLLLQIRTAQEGKGFRAGVCPFSTRECLAFPSRDKTGVGWTEKDPALPLGWKGLQVQKTLTKVIKLHPGLVGAGVCTKFKMKILFSGKELEDRLS